MNLGIGIQGSNDGREQHLEDACIAAMGRRAKSKFPTPPTEPQLEMMCLFVPELLGSCVQEESKILEIHTFVQVVVTW